MNESADLTPFVKVHRYVPEPEADSSTPAHLHRVIPSLYFLVNSVHTLNRRLCVKSDKRQNGRRSFVIR